MAANPVILCIDDQREVLAALLKDLQPFTDLFDVIECESAGEALEVLDEVHAAGQPIALIISDHVMPGVTGVDLLSTIESQERFMGTRKILLTGLATHKDTIDAINNAAIDRYISKPWKPDTLVAVVKNLITRFVLEQYPGDYRRFQNVLDGEVLMEHMQKRGGIAR